LSAAPGEELELSIESLAAGGDGVARADGLAVFVPRSAPGDRVRARVTDSRPRFARAEIVEVLAPGPARREPPCPYYGRCGGCDWLHLDEAEQLRARAAIAREALARIGGIAALPELELVASPRALGYRARARVAYEPGRVGFRSRGSREVVDVERCAVLEPAAQSALDALRRAPPRGSGERELRGRDALEVGGRRLSLPPGAFFQANAALWERWLATVLELCGSGARAVELYCGIGFYTAGLVERFARVVALEGEAVAAAAAARNAPGAEIVSEAAERWAPRELAKRAPELVLLNPPRPGCHRKVSDALAACGAKRVVYVSCEAATLARDLARLGARFRVARLVLLDALPQTHHVELVARLEAD